MYHYLTVLEKSKGPHDSTGKVRDLNEPCKSFELFEAIMSIFSLCSFW